MPCLICNLVGSITAPTLPAIYDKQLHYLGAALKQTRLNLIPKVKAPKNYTR
ncbi:hypothetical protein PAGA_a0554 [Pseudoalteromonas agarivorans DSM 14585]|uniref:Uncharacterized protein n=1 Tax=Pseudoalteromonas agarivorans DSM 14585 TaxID=1312369 RepID=A0ACA8DT26_9GAMM|nr:hypothetical protein PAGA_a0554 [Pseudoalteromonas agarivorans DSM 14585]